MMALAVPFFPKILQPIDYSDCVFDADRINEGLRQLREYPLSERECFLPEGTNLVVGSYADLDNKKIVWFNRNSNGDNGTYEYSISRKTVKRII